jgi:protein-S-isoprenylcysteine O-methyltransferase Ste14
MHYYRPRCSTEPNCCLPVVCYWFDSQISPGSSLTDSMNGSNAVMIGTPTRYVTILGHPAHPRLLGRVRRHFTSRLLPAAALSGLVFWQLGSLVPALRGLNAHPGWTMVGVCLRSVLYALFLCFPIAAFLTHEPPRTRDGRLRVECAAIASTFLLAGLGLLAPGGPVLWRSSPVVVGIALAATLAGVTLAVASAYSLGANFSFGPQGRTLVVRGPYRLVRHPIYLAELAMIAGVSMADVRLIPMIGAGTVVVLQLVRIRAEERLLGSTFPGFSRYAAVTRFRLVPLVW